MPSVYGTLQFGRGQTLSFGISEAFNRSEDPPYINNTSATGGASQPITRDVNVASASVRWAPGGGRLATSLSYTNTVDVFETGSLRVANSMGNLLMLDTTWKWLPKTALVVQVSQGYITYFNTAPNGESKPTSFPLHALVGVRGLITAKLTVNLGVGYANGFYDIPPTPNRLAGPSGIQGNLSAIGRCHLSSDAPLTAIGFGYRHDFQNAILGDFYYVDGVYVNVGQAIAGRLGLGSVRPI